MSLQHYTEETLAVKNLVNKDWRKFGGKNFWGIEAHL